LPEAVLQAFDEGWKLTQEAGVFPYWRSYSSYMPGRESLDPGASYNEAKKKPYELTSMRLVRTHAYGWVGLSVGYTAERLSPRRRDDNKRLIPSTLEKSSFEKAPCPNTLTQHVSEV
jgi:hypothetical protein